MKKFITVIILTILLMNSSLLLVISTAIDNVINQIEIEPLKEIKLEKYVNYDFNNNRGVMVKLNLKTGIEYKNDVHKPLKSSQILLNTAKINEEYPEKIEVVGKSTKVTNGGDNAKDYEPIYDKESGKIVIITSNNEDENGNIYSDYNENARDEYDIILYYSSNCYNNENEERFLDFTGTVRETLADEYETNVDSGIEESYKVTQNISSVISTEISTSEIYNGYINANVQNGTNIATQYTENINVNLDYKEISDEIQIMTNNKFINTKEEQIDTDEIIYKNTRINKNDVLNKLGEDGYLQILNDKGEILGEINKDTEVSKEDGTVEITYNEEIHNLIVKMSKPIQVGDLLVQSTKEIKSTMTDMNNKKIKVESVINCENNVVNTVENAETHEIVEETTQQKVYEFKDENITEIKDAVTKIDLSVDKTEWTNNIKNDVIFTVNLVTEDDKNNLFKNPEINIKLPNEVEKVILDDASLLYNNNFKIKKSEFVEDNGKKQIRVKLEGIQNEYTANSMTNTNVIIPATIILKKDINDVEGNIELTYSNESGIVNDYISEENDSKDIKVNIKSMLQQESDKDNRQTSEGNVVPINAEYNLDYSNLAVKMKAQVGDKVLEEGDSVYEGQIIKYSVEITNNSDIPVSGLKLVGDVPEGTTYAKLKKLEDLTPEEREEIKDEEDAFDYIYEYIKNDSVKTYLEDINTIAPHETITKFYEVEVNDLSETEREKISQINIYIRNQEEQEIAKYTISNKVEKAELKLKLKSQDNLSNVDQNKWIYYLQINNVSGRDLENLQISFQMPKYLNSTNIFLLVGEHDLTVGEMDDNNIVKMQLEKIDNDEELVIAIFTEGKNYDANTYEYEIVANAKVSGEDINEYNANENRQTMYVEGVEVIQYSEKEGKEIAYNEEIEYQAVIKNVGKSLKQERTYINIIDYLPDNLMPISAEYETYEYNQETGEYTKQTKELDLTTKFIPEGKDPEEVADINNYLIIPMGEQLNIKIKAKAKIVNEKTEISNIITVKGDKIVTKTSNIIKTTILPYNYEENESGDPNDPNNPSNPEDPDNPSNPEDPDNPSNPENPDNPSNPEDPNNPSNPNQKYNISGLVWLDSNKDGKRDNGENNISGITVKLYDANTKSLIRDDSGNGKIVTTDNKGKYSFDNISQGQYLVLFEYDTEKYNITNYQASGVSDTLNSDAISKSVSIDGQEKKVGVTNILKVTNSNIENIDMGLKQIPQLDFSLKKYITKVTVVNAQGTNQYNFNKTQLAKIEIPTKYFVNSDISIEYKIVVTNEGKTTGYINEILDYLPEGLSFDGTKNKNWSKNSNGELSTSSLSGNQINPGESKEISLILTKTLNNNEAVTITNTAEIGNILNTENLSDVDSTVKNKNKSEDDYSEAELIISIKTGIVTYTIISIITLVILIAIAMLIKKKKINLKKIKLVLILGIVIGITFYQNVSNAVDVEAVKRQIMDETQAGIGNEPWHISSDSPNFVTNQGDYETDDIMQLHCITGDKAMCANGDHEYERDHINIFEEVDTLIGSSKQQPIWSKDDSRVKMERYNQDWNIVGPYRLSGNWKSIQDLVVYCSGYQQREHNILNSAKQLTGGVIPNGEDFYVLVPLQYTSIGGIGLTFNFPEYTNSYSVSCKVQEIWMCTKVSPEGQHYTVKGVKVGCGDPSKAQTLERLYHKTITIGEKGFEQIPITLGGTSLKGDLKITKKDVDTGVPLQGAKFRITGPNCDKEVTTDENGSVTVKDLVAGTYTVEEKEAPNGYILSLQTNTKITKQIKAGETTTFEFFNKKYGNLKITKRDADDPNITLQGFRFRITGPNKYIREVTTGGDGSVTVKDLVAGEYTVEEIGVPKEKGYILSLQTNTKITKQIKAGETTSFEFTNKKYGNLQIQKVDKDTGQTLKYKGIKFKVYIKDEKNNKKYISYKNNNYKDSKGNEVQKPATLTYTTKDKATPLTTDENGCTETWYNLPINQEYYIEEIELPKELQKYYEIKTEETGPFSLENNETKTVNVVRFENKQLYIDISGTVWEDKVDDSKLTKRNDLYKEDKNDNADKPVAGITVRLKWVNYITRNRPPIVTKIGEVSTDKDGNYKFEKVSISILNSNINGDYCYIEFEYNGLKYTNVVKNLNEDNGSKAIESTADRTAFNKSFSKITYYHPNSEEKGKTYGRSINAEGHVSNTLTYEKDENNENTVLLVDKTGYTVDSAEEYVKLNKSNNSNGVKMIATTKNAGYDLRWKLNKNDLNANREIKNINLGIYEREQPDIGISKDINSIKLTINGKEQIYNYLYRYNHFGKSSSDIGVKFGTEYNEPQYTQYTRAIYESDYTYTNENKDKELKAYITYQIIITNMSESDNLKVKVNSLVDYFDSRYSVVSVGTKFNDEKGTISESINWSEDKNFQNEKFKKININIDKDAIECGSTQSLYVQFELSREAIAKILESKTSSNNTINLLDNVVEINSYSTYKDGNIYAGIDKNSAPGNAEPGDMTTYENDTDKAPALKLEIADARKITGTVFLDSAEPPDGYSDEETKELMTGEKRLGNGFYDKDEQGIKGVKVTLKENSGSKQTYTTTTDNNGNFEITSYIPGEYTLTYTWGNKQYKVQNYKSTTVNKDGYDDKERNSEWYKTTHATERYGTEILRASDAVDDYDARQTIDSQSSEITNYNKNVIDNYDSNQKLKLSTGETDLITTMDSTTPKMSMGIEYNQSSGQSASTGKKYKYNVENIDFGIIERARQELELTKRIKSIKLSLSNGQVLSNLEFDDNGKVTEQGEHIIYMKPGKETPTNGIAKIELDSELIQSSKLEVTYSLKVKNLSEIDYLSEDYYKYGKPVGEEVTLKATKIIDYLDNDWPLKENNEIWQIIKTETLKNMVSGEVLSNESTINNKDILYTTILENKSLTPGQESGITFTVSKILANTDEIILNNEAEIIEVIKPGGSVISTVPGNYIPGTLKKTELDDDVAETVTVILPSGENRNYIIPIVIGITVLTTIGVGIVVIKKKVLK